MESIVTNMIESPKRPKLVGNFIRQRREALNLSQRALGLLFDPPVTTQFISNVERGVTPLPPAHVPTLTRALQVSEADMMGLLEKEYTLKLSGRLGIQQNTFGGQSHGGAVIIPMNGQLGASQPQMTVSNHDYEFMRSLYEAYKSADSKTRQTFTGICETVLNLSGRNTQQPSSQSAVVVAAASSGIAAERP
jgi:transcriptional regulator with XRE-family HTH domain